MRGRLFRTRESLLISPEFEGIKTQGHEHYAVAAALLISPEFEGIKTKGGIQRGNLVALLISPEFEGIKTRHRRPGRCRRPRY